MLKSKIHRAELAGIELDYEGSISIDENLLEKADILPGEQGRVLNVHNDRWCISDAPVTTFIAKDRVLAHNTTAAIYCQYIRKKLIHSGVENGFNA